ncbi:MAG: peptidoglycan-binding protein [Oscillospiraceae bacterium]|nr:peptidoglycan-binding protein [Oscillospiraceae bacterium]
MTKTQEAVSLALKMAEDPAHGYDQADRWGPDFDCSSFIITVWEQAGVPVKSAGASYTGNMYSALIKCGFIDVTNFVNRATGDGLQKGDVLLNKANHTEMYIGDGKVVKASINEHGTATGGRTGDQTGREIYVGNYYNYPWDCVLRFMGEDSPDPPEEEKPEVKSSYDLPMLRKGDKGETVKALKALLILHGFRGNFKASNSYFGVSVEKALIRFQKDHGLEQDGICGPITWGALLGVK